MKIKQIIKRGIRYVLHGVPVIIKKVEIKSLPANNLLEGKTILITGGSSGIGYAIALSCIKSGAKVIITGRKIDRINKTIKDVKILFPEAEICGYELDNSKIGNIDSSLQTILYEHPDISCLVNNAGVNGGYLLNCTEDEYDLVLDTNLKGTVFITRIIANHMINNHIEGNILNICSSSSIRPATSAYTLSKWGLKGFTIGMAKKLIQYGIVVNGIAPGPTATPMLVANTDDINLPNNPSQRYALPEEIANMAVILISGLGRLVVGDILYMTGGAGTITIDDINY